TLDLDPGQTVAVLVTPTPSSALRPTVQLLDPSDTVLGAATAAAAGQSALLQPVAVTAGGTYKVVVSGADSTTGGYRVKPVLNAAVEEEGALAGAGNDTRETAQGLDGSFVTLQTSQGSAQRA